MGNRPSSGQAWKRYAVLGDPDRPSANQAWPRYGVGSSRLWFVDVNNIATQILPGTDFGPHSSTVYEVDINGGDSIIGVYAINPPFSAPVILDQTLTLRDKVTGAQIGNTVAWTSAMGVLSFTPGVFDPPGFYCYPGIGFDLFTPDLWNYFGITTTDGPPPSSGTVGSPCYLDVDCETNIGFFTIRFAIPGYAWWPSFTVDTYMTGSAFPPPA